MVDPREEAEILRGLIDQGKDVGGSDKSDAEVDDMQVTENADGSATVTRATKKPSSGKKDFYRNLAEDLDDDELQTIGSSLLELIKQDKKAREKRDEQYEEGMKRMGLDKETLGGANFEGASRVTHPMYTKACIDFEARSIKELWPPGGPVREYIPGTITPERADRAHRKAQWLNFQLCQLMPNLRPEMEQLLINLPMSGNCYEKLIPPSRGIDVGHEWIPVDKMLLPFAATNFYSAERRTHIQEITAQEFQRRMRVGMYRNVPTIPSSQPEPTKSQEVAARIEGKESDNSNPDGQRVVYECDCLFEIRDPDVPRSHTESLQEDAGQSSVPGDAADSGTVDDEANEVGPAPYLISIDETTQQVLGIYRNWDERDNEKRERLEWTVEWIFIPFRGSYALGLPHIIGGLSIAATGALRALLDSAHINTLAGLIKLKGAAGTGQTLRVSPTEVTEIENSGEIDDIRKLIMAVPFGPPSPVLLTLLGLLGDQAEAVIRTTIDEAEANADVPVGTTLARIEQGMVAFSAIHSRLHSSMDRMLKILHRINATYLDDQEVVKAIGEALVTKADFDTAADVIPVSDPNIFCEVQRYGQIQTVAQRAVLLPQVYDARRVEELILKQMKLPNDGKDLLVPKPTPQQMNPVNENVAVSLGRPIVAFPQQDHEAHIQCHCDWVENPFFSMALGGNLAALGGLAQNLREHLVFWYATKVHELASREATAAAKENDPKSGEVDIGDLPQNNDQDPEIAQLYDRMLAAASAKVMMMAQQNPLLQKATQTLQKLTQRIQQMQPPPMMDPGQAAMADVQRQTKRDEADAQIKQAQIKEKTDQAQQATQAKMAIAQQHEQAESQRRAAQDYTKQQTTSADNATALEIASMREAMGHIANVTNGEAVGKSPPKTGG